MGGDRIPFYSEVNNTNIRIYYNDGKSTTEIVVNKETGGGKGCIIGKRRVKLCPDDISIKDLLNLNQLSGIESRKVQAIVSAAKAKFTKYLANG